MAERPDHANAVTVPPPGSNAAIELGCRCPVMDNARGRGRGRDQFGRVVYVYNCDCEVHGG